MSHNIHVIIGDPLVLGPLKLRYKTARIVPLDVRIAMIPMTSELFDEITDKFSSQETSHSVDGFQFLTSSIAKFLQTTSRAGPIAYIETDYFGGLGGQSAAAWSGGKVALSPETSQQLGPINRALAQLGVKRESKFDEFDTIGLGRFRSMDDMTINQDGGQDQKF